MSDRRVQPEDFIAAVKRTGVMPTRGLWVAGNRTCAIGAIAVDRKQGNRAAAFATDAEGLGLTSQYVSGFIGGFDGVGYARNHPDEQTQLGFDDGRACAHACFDEQLHLQYTCADVDLGPYMQPPDGGEEQPVYVTVGGS